MLAELSSDTSVMAIGGFMNDPTPTLDQFKDYVKNHQVTYYIVQSRGGEEQRGAQQDAPGKTPRQGQAPDSPMSNRFGGHQDIADWVAATFKPITAGGATVYDMSGYTG